ncbi:MAG TPA: hypothetical protein VHY08_09110 [Bacillota bacterium]|nr:hypothetical protein [Bacillota bacterium]
MKRLLLLTFFVLFIFAMVGCGGGSTPQGNRKATPTPFPVDTIVGEPDSEGLYQFYTNNLYFCNKGLWMILGGDTHIYNPMDSYPLDVEIKKESGYVDYGYGIIFCAQYNGDITGCYRLLITTDGYYSLVKMTADGYSVIPDTNNPTPQEDYFWAQCTALNQGYGVINRVKIVRSLDINSQVVFTVYFNDLVTPAFTFTDDTYPGGYIGFYASVGEAYEESFPGTPVDVRFKLNTPDISATSLHTTQKIINYGVKVYSRKSLQSRRSSRLF